MLVFGILLFPRQNHLTWLTNYAFPECVTDTEDEDVWDARMHAEFNSAGSFHKFGKLSIDTDRKV